MRGISAPAASHACNSVYSGGISISLPSTMILVIDLLRRYHMRGIADALIVEIGLVRIFVDPGFDLVTEVRDQTLDRPRRRVSQCADGVALDLLGDLKQHVDLALVCAALGHAGQHAPHPSCSLAAGRALAAALMLV